jgi:hypothetical protein
VKEELVMTMTLTLHEPLASQLASAAGARETSVEALAETVLRAFLDEEADRKLDRELEAFRAMHADLLASYRDEYVAIHQGRVIDHDLDELALFLRIDEQYPDVPVLIRKVRPEVEEVYTIRSPRFSYE